MRFSQQHIQITFIFIIKVINLLISSFIFRYLDNISIARASF